MKKIFTLLAVLFCFTTLNAQLLHEPFAYTADPVQGLAAQSGGAWQRVNTGDSILVEAGNLTYTGLPSSTGNRITYGGSGTDYYTSFANQTAGTIYYSFLLNVATVAPLSATGDYFTGFIENGSTTNYFARTWMKSDGAGGYLLGINPGSNTANTQWAATALSEGTTYLVVVSFEIVAGTQNDIAKIWINPTVGSPEPAADATSNNSLSGTANDPSTGIQRLLLRQGSASAAAGVLQMDELRVGTAWADVTPNASSPSLTADPTALSGFATVFGSPSASQSFDLEGSNLTGGSGNISVTAPANFEISLNSGGPYSGSLNVPFSGGALSTTTLYARISFPASLGAVSGTITCTGGSASANVSVSGNVLEAQPTIQATNVTITSITDNTFDLNWTPGNGSFRIVVVRQTTATNALPADGTNYTASTIMGSGQTTGSGNYVVYNGSGTGPLTVTNLFPGTNYTVSVYEYNASVDGTDNYLTNSATGNPASASTTGITNLLTQGYFTGIAVPQYMASYSSGAQNRIPTMFFAKISGLAPNTVYKYYTQAAASTDFGTTATGAGGSLLIDYNTTTTTPVTYTYVASGSFTGTNYSFLTSDANGNFQGSFGFIHTTNSRFTKGNTVYPSIVLVDDAGGSTSPRYRFALDQSITTLEFATAADAVSGSFIQGGSNSIPGNLVALWRSVDGNLVATRPLSMTLAEIAGSATGWIGSNAIAGYDYTAGAWNTIMPNMNEDGIKLIQQINPLNGSIVGCNSDADGTWPTGPVPTSDPVNGPTALVIDIADAPLDGGTCYAILPVTLGNFIVAKQFNTVKISWTTQQEVNSKEFVIERSIDGIHWAKIKTVPAAGHSTVAITYTSFDDSPLKGMNYYRIKLVDQDNRSTQSIVRSVLFSTQYLVAVSPNPATDYINLNVSGNTTNAIYTVTLTDMSGKKLIQTQSSSDLLRIPAHRLTKGMYILSVSNAGSVVTQKVVIQ